MNAFIVTICVIVPLIRLPFTNAQIPPINAEIPQINFQIPQINGQIPPINAQQQQQQQQLPPVPIATVIVAEQQLATTTQQPSNPANELVDQIESIDVSSTQLIITSTRQGPPDTARVACLIYSKSYAGGSAIYTNEEAHLVKTHRVDGSHEDGNPPVVSVRAQRYGDSGRSLENLVTEQRNGTARTMVAEFVGYEMAPNGEKAEEADAYVQLTAIAIPEAKKADNSTIRFKTFNTKKEGEQYVLDNMEPGKLYAVQYTYGKQSPFVYEESRRFLLDMASGMTPVHVQYNLTEPYSDQPGVAATAKLDPKFNQYELGIDVEPLCEPNESTLHFWLTKDRPEKELHELRLLDALCTAMPQHSVCHRAPGSSTAAAAAAGDAHRCAMPDAKLCYTSNIVVHEKIFSAPRKCEQLADEVPAVPTTTSTSTTSTTKSTSATRAKSSPPGTTPAPKNASGAVVRPSKMLPAQRMGRMGTKRMAAVPFSA
ncbi:hypothetical protein GPALN_011652 [Globodera pallida]|nr:hypothetical protein GPALN_011652 [Globodera pallida]